MTDQEWGGRAQITAGMIHAPHISPATVKEQRDKTPEYLRAAVIDGDPTMGAGNVYQVPRRDIEYDYIRNASGKYIEVPAHWKRIGGLDVGKYTAFVALAYDTDNDTLYVVDEYFTTGFTPPAVISAAIRHRKGDKYPIMIDPASNGRNAIDGRALIIEYRKERLDVRPADNTVEAGIHACWERFSTGRLKIFKHCTSLLKEYEMYQRNLEGKILKKNDHGMDALRYAVMGRKFAKLIYQTSDLKDEYKNPYDFSRF